MAKASAKKKPAKSNGTGKTREEHLTSLLTVKAKENPRREGTAAHKFHEAMVKSKTVHDYYNRFSKDKKLRRDASLWLSSSIRDGIVKLQKAPKAA